MNLVSTLNSILGQLRPFISTIALLFGVIAAWHGLAELLPVVKSIWSPRGTAVSMGTVGACLAIIAGRA